MTYIEEIESLIKNVNKQIVDFDKERIRGTAPTQVSSEFLTNKEQGDWAEKTFMDGINNNSDKYIAVKYGRDDDIIAGEDGFKQFYESYQDELDIIGKRPDILIFEKKDFTYDTTNISNMKLEELDKIVPLAKCGIEVRSSAFLIEKYEDYMNFRNNMLLESVMSLKKIILSNYSTLLASKDKALFDIVNMISEDNVHILSFRSPTWRSTPELTSLSTLLKDLNTNLKAIKTRTFLSITPKVEDLKVVYNWIKKYNVPHYYVQVFFDKAYGISFKRILQLIGNPDLEGKDYFVESDIKNQNKTTIKIHANKEANILEKVYLPEHFSDMKELGRGRLLFYVKFKNSVSIINYRGFKELFGIDLNG